MTIRDIKRANQAAGHHFFDKDTMQFFQSCISHHIFEGPGGTFFITSEQFVSSTGTAHKRRFTVRRFDTATGAVQTHGNFNALDTRHDAAMIARAAAKGKEL